MSVNLRQVLPTDAGLNLPEPVRQALVDHGLACNLVAVAVNQAAQLDEQAGAQHDHMEALRRGEPVDTAAGDVAEATDRFHSLTLVALARAATTYAVYATQLAVQIAAGEPVTDPGDAMPRLKPSDLIAALGRYLPPLSFEPREDSERQQVADLNADIQRSYRDLNNVISHQLHGVDVTLYDDLSAATKLDAKIEVLEVFPFAVYDYAATVAWAVGMRTGVDEDA
jgi:hypothetical protein